MRSAFLVNFEAQSEAVSLALQSHRSLHQNRHKKNSICIFCTGITPISALVITTALAFANKKGHIPPHEANNCRLTANQ